MNLEHLLLGSHSGTRVSGVPGIMDGAEDADFVDAWKGLSIGIAVVQLGNSLLWSPPHFFPLGFQQYALFSRLDALDSRLS